jgi:hypothetical protein
MSKKNAHAVNTDAQSSSSCTAFSIEDIKVHEHVGQTCQRTINVSCARLTVREPAEKSFFYLGSIDSLSCLNA